MKYLSKLEWLVILSVAVLQIGHSPTCANYQDTSVVPLSPVCKPTYMYIETIKFYHGQKIKFHTVTVIILVARSKNLNVFL